MCNFAQKHASTIALIVAIIALFATLIPQITEFMNASGSSDSNAPQGAPAKGPGMPGPGGPGMGGHGGPGSGMRGMSRKPSEELQALFAKRLALFDEAIKNASAEEAAKLRCERDQFRVQVARQNRGGFRMNAGAAEAFVKYQNSKNCPKATPLCKNLAEIDYQKAVDGIRGDKQAFLDVAKKLENYPATPLADEDIEALLDAETPQMGPMGGPGAPVPPKP